MRILADKPANSVMLTGCFIMLFEQLLRAFSWMQSTAAFRSPLINGTSRNRPLVQALLSCFLTQETFLCTEIVNAVNTELHVNPVICECGH